MPKLTKKANYRKALVLKCSPLDKYITRHCISYALKIFPLKQNTHINVCFVLYLSFKQGLQHPLAA